jgi:hypothetical protein
MLEVSRSAMIHKEQAHGRQRAEPCAHPATYGATLTMLRDSAFNAASSAEARPFQNEHHLLDNPIG